MSGSAAVPSFLLAAGPSKIPDGATADAAPAVLFIDNGGDSIKAMYVAAPSAAPRFLVVPNCVGSSPVGGDAIVGAAVDKLPDYHGFVARRPVADGFIADVGRQAQVWEYVLQHFGIGSGTERQTRVWLTAPHGAPREVGRAVRELLAEQFSFHSVVFVSATFLSLLAGEAATAAPSPAPGTGLVVDVGFSGTTIVPYVNHAPVLGSIVRMDVGGRFMTARLSEAISFRHTNLSEDGWLVNTIKERCCYVDAPAVPPAAARRVPTVEYFLPSVPALRPLGCTGEELDDRLDDGAPASRRQRLERGSSKADEGGAGVDRRVLAMVRLGEERVYTPGLLFAPQDGGVAQMGVVECVVEATTGRGLMAAMPLLRAAVMRGVHVCGGSSQFPGLRERLERELREKTPQHAGEEFALRQVNVKAATALAGEGIGAAAGPGAAALQPLCGAAWLLTTEDGAAVRARVEGRTLCALKGAQEADVEDIHEAMQRMP